MSRRQLPKRERLSHQRSRSLALPLVKRKAVNRPWAMAPNNSKPYQALPIRSLGFAVPDTRRGPSVLGETRNGDPQVREQCPQYPGFFQACRTHQGCQMVSNAVPTAHRGHRRPRACRWRPSLRLRNCFPGRRPPIRRPHRWCGENRNRPLAPCCCRALSSTGRWREFTRGRHRSTRNGKW
jgi:hypothetical protein